MNIVIITGASSGIGKEFALQLDQGLYTVEEFWLVARRRERLEELAAGLSHAARVIPADLTDAEDRKALRALLEKEKPAVRMLINCSGYGIMGDFSDLELEEQTGMLDLNCRALTEMTYLCLPYLKKRSRIIQVASSAAFLPQPGFAVYAASKSYVLSFTRALREELKGRGIKVTAVCPGPVRTEFFDRAKAADGTPGRALVAPPKTVSRKPFFAANAAHRGAAEAESDAAHRNERKLSIQTIKKYTMADADRVVRAALKASARGSALSVYSPAIKAFRLLTKLVPHSLILAVMRFMKGT